MSLERRHGVAAARRPGGPAGRGATGRAAAEVEAVLGGERRRPDDRPYRRRDRQPDPVAGQEAVGGRPERRRGRRWTRPGSSGAGSACDVAVGQVEDPGRHLERRPVGRHVLEADDRGRDRRPATPRRARRPRPRRRRAPRPSGAEVKIGISASSGREVAGEAVRARSRRPTTAPARVPTVARWRNRSTAGASPVAARRAAAPTSGSGPGARWSTRSVDPGRRPRRHGEPLARARPTGNGSGRISVVAEQRRAAGSSITPLSTPFSQWSKKRTSSWCQSRFGPGYASSG